MDSSPVALPSSPSEEASSPATFELTHRANARRSRVTSDAIADLWTSPEAQSPAELPENLAGLGEALDKALHSDGAVSEAYSAFADQAFGDPAAIPAASRFIARLFAGQQGVLVNLVRTKDLLAALEHGSSELPRMIALRWQAGVMTQRISRFGESLILHHDRLKNPAAAEVLAAFAGLLALNKPDRADTLFELATKAADPPGSAEFVEDVRCWLSAGHLVESLPAENRGFWQQCLRKSEAGTDWSGPEARSALEALARRLRRGMPCAVLFQETVPVSWWREQMESRPAGDFPAVTQRDPAPELAAAVDTRPQSQEPASAAEPAPAPAAEPAQPEPPASTIPPAEAKAAPSPPEPPRAEAARPRPVPLPAPVQAPPTAPATPQTASSSKVPVFLLGQLMGMALVLGIWVAQPDLLSRVLSQAGPLKAGKPARPVSAAIVPATTVPAATVPAATVPAVPPPQAEAFSVAKAQVICSGDQWRLQEVAILSAGHAPLKPWVVKAQYGSWEECSTLVTGRHPTAYPTRDDYVVFLKWLVLELPRDPDLHRAVPRLYVRVAPISELIDLCEHLSYPGSPNADDVPTMAQIALEAHRMLIAPADRLRLEKLAGTP